MHRTIITLISFKKIMFVALLYIRFVININLERKNNLNQIIKKKDQYCF